MESEHIGAVLRAIPQTRDCDRPLFGLLYTTGVRVGEALSIEVGQRWLNSGGKARTTIQAHAA